MSKRWMAAAALAILLTWAGTAECAITPLLRVDTLVRDSDVVVVGRITSTADAGPVRIERPDAQPAALEGRASDGVIVVDRVVKGSGDLREVRFWFATTDASVFIGYEDVRPDTYRMLFLKARNGRFEVTSPYHPSLIASPDTRSSGSEPLERAVLELGGVLASASTTVAQKHEAIRPMWSVKHAAVSRVLRPLLEDREMSLRLRAAAALLAADDIAALPAAESALRDPDAALPPGTIESLRGAMAFGVKDPAAVASLARLLKSRDVETRRAAADALRHTQAAIAIGALGGALDDADLKVRYSAVAGLAEITGDSAGMTSVPVFNADPDKYVAYWKKWLAGRH